MGASMRMSLPSPQGCTFFSIIRIGSAMDSNLSARLALSHSLQAVSRPLLRVCFRGGISIGELRASIDHAAVREAEAYLLALGKKPTYSNISIITGIARHTVKKLLVSEVAHQPASDAQLDRARRVLNGWLDDPAFHDGHGRPKELRLTRGRRSFLALVRRYAGGVGHAAILQRLVETRAVQVSEPSSGRDVTVVRLVRAEQVFEVDDAARFDQLGKLFGAALEGFDKFLAHPSAPDAVAPRSVEVALPLEAVNLIPRRLVSALDSSARTIRALVKPGVQPPKRRRGEAGKAMKSCVVTVALLPCIRVPEETRPTVQRAWRRPAAGRKTDLAKPRSVKRRSSQ